MTIKKSKRRYDDSVSVCWRDVLRCLTQSLDISATEAQWALKSFEANNLHNYSERAERDKQRAFCFSEHAFHYNDLLSTLRRFLRYKSSTTYEVKLKELKNFYEQNKIEPPCNDSLVASITGRPYSGGE